MVGVKCAITNLNVFLLFRGELVRSNVSQKVQICDNTHYLHPPLSFVKVCPHYYLLASPPMHTERKRICDYISPTPQKGKKSDLGWYFSSIPMINSLKVSGCYYILPLPYSYLIDLRWGLDTSFCSYSKNRKLVSLAIDAKFISVSRYFKWEIYCCDFVPEGKNLYWKTTRILQILHRNATWSEPVVGGGYRDWCAGSPCRCHKQRRLLS